MKGKTAFVDSVKCKWIDLVILLSVVRISETGGEKSCEIASSMGKSELFKKM